MGRFSLPLLMWLSVWIVCILIGYSLLLFCRMLAVLPTFYQFIIYYFSSSQKRKKEWGESK